MKKKTQHEILIHRYIPDEKTPDKFEVVAIEVIPSSVQYNMQNKTESTECPPVADAGGELILSNKESIDVTWSYTVTWIPSQIPGSERLQQFLKLTRPNAHWFSIVNSLVIVLFLSALVGMIFMRTLFSDIRKYNEDPEDEVETTGWKVQYFYNILMNPLLLYNIISNVIIISNLIIIYNVIILKYNDSYHFHFK